MARISSPSAFPTGARHTTPLFVGVLVAGCLGLPAGASGQDAQPTIDLPPELARVLTDYETAYGQGGTALAALFAPDGFVLARGRPPVHGRDAIARYYGNGGGPLYLRAFAYETRGDVGYILGGYTYAPGQPDLGKFTLTLTRDTDGRWLIFSDMDNSNRSPGR